MKNGELILQNLPINTLRNNLYIMAFIVESKIQINTPVDWVWQTLSDFETYDQWNPFTPKIEISQNIGSDVILHVRMNPQSSKIIKQKETLLVWEEPQQIDWGITNSMFLDTVRTQRLRTLDAMTTEYYTSDIIKGPISLLVKWGFQKKIKHGFDQVALSLKNEAERRYKASVAASTT